MAANRDFCVDPRKVIPPKYHELAKLPSHTHDPKTLQGQVD